MKLADLNTGMSQLREAMESLRQSWHDVGVHWNDANRRNFEEQHLLPLSIALTTAFPAIDQMAQLLNQAGRDCAPWDGDSY